MDRGRYENKISNNKEDIQKMIRYVDSGSENYSEIVDLFRSGGHIQKLADSDTKPKSHQLRRFYDYLVNIENRSKTLGNEQSAESALRLQLLRMIPIAEYSRKRKFLDQQIQDFISGSAEAVARKRNVDFIRSLERFRDVYEALVAYSKEEK